MKQLLSALALCLLLTACRTDKKTEENGLAPMLSADNITMAVGETRRISVINADNISARPASDIVTASVSGQNIDITARSAGQTVIHVTAGRTPLRCAVTVNDTGGTGSRPETPQLLDSSCRFECSTLVMRYSTPGTIVSSDGETIEFRSLDSGDHIVSTPGGLTVNDKTSSAPRAVMKTTADTTWFCHRDAADTCWIVIENKL